MRWTVFPFYIRAGNNIFPVSTTKDRYKNNKAGDTNHTSSHKTTSRKEPSSSLGADCHVSRYDQVFTIQSKSKGYSELHFTNNKRVMKGLTKSKCNCIRYVNANFTMTDWLYKLHTTYPADFPHDEMMKTSNYNQIFSIRSKLLRKES